MISEMSIARFKAIRSASLPLKHLNLFAGINGMGKSSCLQTLLLLRQSFAARTLPSTGLLLRGELADLGRGEDVLHQFEEEETIEFSVATQRGSARWVFGAREGDGLDQEILPQIAFEESYPPVEGSVSGAYDQPPFLPGFRYLSAERVRPEVAYDTSFYSVHELDQIGPKGEFAVHYLSEHQNRALAIPSLRHTSLTQNQSDLLSNVRAWIGEISPGISLAVQQYPMINKAAVNYEYDTGPASRFSNPLRPTNVGFGITYCLPIIVATLASQPGDMLLIENPESHLHPSGQSHIGRLLSLAAAGGVQILVETHSDHVLNGIRVSVRRGEIPSGDVAIFSFDRQRGDPSHRVQITRPTIDRNGKIDAWPPGFFDETEKLLFELL